MEQKHPSALIFFEATLAVVIWGATFVATKIAIQQASPVTIVWLRFLMGTIILGVVTHFRKQFAFPAVSDWPYLMLVGFIGVTFHQYLQATGLITAQATVTAWIVATIPIFSAFLGWLFLKENFSPLRVFGIAIATIGVLLVVSNGNLASIFTGGFGTPGDFLILVSAVNWAVFSILSRRGLQKYPPTLMMFYVMLTGWLFSTIWLFGFGPGLQEIAGLNALTWINILILGIFGSGIAYIAWYDSLQSLSVTQLSVFIYIEPLVTTLIAGLFQYTGLFQKLGIREEITLAVLVGGGLTILGVYLVNLRQNN